MVDSSSEQRESGSEYNNSCNGDPGQLRVLSVFALGA